MGKILGIDLGTTNSVMAVMDKNGPTIIPNGLGDRTTPSVVGFTKSGDVLVGKKARRGAIMNVGRTVFSAKRHMGTSHRFEIEGKQYTSQEISAMILQKLKSDAEDFFGEPINEAIVTVPAYFTDAQRQATKDAGEIAGFTVRRIIDEPSAAALAYGLDKDKDQVLMVYDFGGGTFDVSIIEVTTGVFQVLSIHGDNMLGGDDFDQRIIKHLLDEFKTAHDIDLSGDPIAMQRLKDAAEEAKIDLSEMKETTILVEAIAMTDKGPLTLDTTMTRAKFEELVEDLIKRTIPPLEAALKDAKKKPNEIDTVLLVGGTTRVPMVQEVVKEAMQQPPQRDISPDEVVAMGAAVQSLVLAPLDSKTGEDLATHYGKEKPVIIHLTPFSLGVGLQADQFGVIIERNSTYPTEAKDIFTTTRDFQEAITFPIYEGESLTASDNTFLDVLRIEGITPAPRGVPRIEVTFKLTPDRILEARGEDIATGVEKKITVQATDRRLTEEEKVRMVGEAKERLQQDVENKASAEMNDEVDRMCGRAETLLKENPDHARAKDLQTATDDVRRLAQQGAKNEEMDDMMDHLSRVITEVEADA